MSEAHSIANKKRWSKIPKNKRSEMMSKVVLIRHEKMTDKEKKEIVKKMLNGKKNKII